jgi:hypothetical protein
MNNNSAIFLSLEGSIFHIINKEIPIIIYKTVQTGPNNQSGGLKDGLWSVAYHPVTADDVNIPAIAPTPSVRINEAMSLIIWVVSITYRRYTC